jgi:hypothetical protein
MTCSMLSLSKPSTINTRIGCIRTLCTKEFAGYVEGFAADDHDLLTVEQLLGHSASQATQKMSFAINDDLSRKLSV